MPGYVRRIPTWGRSLACLLFAALLFSPWPARANSQTPSQPLNASGNRNIPLSVDPVDQGEGYSAILYDNRNGLPTSEANAIAQTNDGFLWIGSYAGLIRYDGVSFERIESPDGILNTRCLYLDSLGRLWIGTNDFGIFLMDGSSLARVDRADQLPSVSIRSIAEDDQGLIYAATAAGVATVDASLTVHLVQDDRLAAMTIQELRPGCDGLMYGLTQRGDLFMMKDGSVTGWLAHEDCGFDSFLAVLPDFAEPGVLYVATVDAGTACALILHGRPEDGFASAKAYDCSPLSTVSRMEWIDGNLWLCAGNGIGRLDSQGLRLLKNTPMDKLVGHVMTDDEGNLWFTSTRQCVMKIVPNRFLDLFGQYGIPSDIVNSTCMLNGRLFIGTDESGLMVVENGKLLDALPLTEARTASGETIQTDDLLLYLRGERVRSVIRDKQDRLWISTWRHNHGLICYDHGIMTAFTRADGLQSNEVRTVSECEDGSILVAQLDGVSLIRDMRVVDGWGAQEGEEAFAFLRAAAEDREAGSEMRGILSMITELDRLDQELELASDIQINSLPMNFPPFPDRKEFDLFASMTPAKEVGGDFYDFFLIDDDHLALVIADVSGKGIPAALFMMVSKGLIKNQMMALCDPAAALEKVNLQLYERNSSMMFVTVWLAVLEISTGKGLACNAGHENPGLCRCGGGFELLQYRHNLCIGVNKKARYQNREFSLEPGDCLFVYTDGVPEATSASGEMFGTERLAKTLNLHADAAPDTLIHQVHANLDAFADGAPQFDDITMLSLKYHGLQSPEKSP